MFVCQIPSVSAACTHAMPYPSYNFRHSRQMLLHSPLQKPFSPLSTWLVRPLSRVTYVYTRFERIVLGLVQGRQFIHMSRISGYLVVHLLSQLLMILKIPSQHWAKFSHVSHYIHEVQYVPIYSCSLSFSLFPACAVNDLMLDGISLLGQDRWSSTYSVSVTRLRWIKFVSDSSPSVPTDGCKVCRSLQSA